MGQRRYPPLTVAQVVQILTVLGYILHHTKGDHRYYQKLDGPIKREAQVDMGSGGYGQELIPALLKETGLTRDQFYGATKATARKINLRAIED